MASFNYDGMTLPAVIRRRAAADGDRVYAQEIGGEARTYGECEANGRLWAAALRDLGVGTGDRVAVMLAPCVAAVEIWLGIAQLGALEVPIHAEYRGQLLEYVLANCGTKVLIIDSRFEDRLSAAAIERAGISAVVTLGSAADAGSHADRAIDGADLLRGTSVLPVGETVLPDLGSAASIIYTSGTTGPSKGVVVSWRQLAGTCYGGLPADDYTPEDIRYCPFPLCHVLGKVSVLGSAINGAGVVLRETFSVSHFWEDISCFGCTTTSFTGAVGHFLYNQPGIAGEESNPLRNIVMSPLPVDLDGFRRRFGVRVYTSYNMTELSTPIVSGWNPDNRTSCGRLRDGYSVRVVDPNDAEVGPGEVGELTVRAADRRALMTGYFGMDDVTAESWRGGWFHTGDAFRYDEQGNYYFVDRRKDSIRRRGENISSLELEREVNLFPGVVECAAVGVPSEVGDDDVLVVLVAKPGVPVEPWELASFLADRVPRFMVPRYIDVAESLPKTPIGKIQKAVLRQLGVSATAWDRQRAG
jgi:crotonobetaine/carnitine-CoA ligase